jgi:hypothetical protein
LSTDRLHLAAGIARRRNLTRDKIVDICLRQGTRRNRDFCHTGQWCILCLLTITRIPIDLSDKRPGGAMFRENKKRY